MTGKSRFVFLLCLAMTALLLSGCMVMDSADLLSLPRLLPDHSELNDLVNEVTAGSRWSSVSPQAGSNRSPVQFIDLYNDGIPEAVVFFFNAKDVQLRVSIYSKTGDSRYRELASIFLSGVQMNRIEYADLNGDGIMEIIIGRSFGAETRYSATVYSLVNDAAEVMLPDTGYTGLYVYEINDHTAGLLLLNHDETGTNAYAELFGLAPGAAEMRSLGKAPLSAGIRTPGKISAGFLNSDTRTVIVDGLMTNQMQYVSDVLVYTEETGLENISFSPIDNYSKVTQRSLEFYAQDVDFDGFLEIPLVRRMPEPEKVEVSPDFYLLWYAYDKQKSLSAHVASYHPSSGLWYLLYPEAWVGRVYTKTSKSPEGADVVSFLTEYNGFQYELLSVYAYSAESEDLEAEDLRFLTKNQGFSLYADLPSASKLADLPDRFRISSLAMLRSLFATIDVYRESEPLVSASVLSGKTK